MPDPRDTPAMRQYYAFKKRHPDCVLFFRMGDFYEMFDGDAVTAHKALGITLTQRTEGVPMAGVPFHSVESYLRRMIEKGFRVAVCDQVQDPKEAKGVVDRAVTRVLTPGTLVDDALLDGDTPNNLAAAAFLDAGDAPEGRVALGVIEVSTGAFRIADTRAADLADELARRNVRELLYAATADGKAPPRVQRVLDALRIPGTPRPAWHFRGAEAMEAVLGHYGVQSLAGFGLSNEDPAIPAAGALIRYLTETQALDTADKATSEGVRSGTALALLLRKRSLAHIGAPKRDDPDGFLILDAPSLRALEIERTIRAAAPLAGRRVSSDGSLVGVFSSSGPSFRGCVTSMGRRLLREWLCRPSARLDEIRARHSAVATLVEDRRAALDLLEALAGVQDVPRIVARVGLARATPRDLVGLGCSLGRLGPIAHAIENAPAFGAHLGALRSLESALAPIAKKIADTCVEEPPSHLREGGLIKDGVDPALDECRALQADSHTWLAGYQRDLIAEFDLPSLKVGYNKVFGYYIELPAAQARRAPDRFTRKQTLKNAERYITPELKAFEDKVLSAGDRAVQREHELFGALCDDVCRIAAQAAAFAAAIAELDVLQCFAAKAAHRAWVRPEIVEAPTLDIRQGRHPVLDEILENEFVPNDTQLGRPEVGGPPPASPSAPPRDASRKPQDGASLALITGPNMAGKSTYIRQVALLVILAQAGSFVPAEAATIGLTDRVFTRIGADDALHSGQSTFMVEMVETANILHHATPRSLIILDEIGRGTSTLDGLSLAWAIAEHLAAGCDQVSRCRGVEVSSEEQEERPARAPLTPGHLDTSTPSFLTPSSASPSSPRTLFATHYHELTDLAERLPGRVTNLHVAVREWGEQIVFLHRILPGRASRSYGIHVAKLAGLPRAVVERAARLLESLSVSHAAPDGSTAADAPSVGDGTLAGAVRRAAERAQQTAGQLSLFTEYVPHPAIEEIKAIDLTRLSPMEAFDALRRLRESVVEPGRAPS